MTARLQNGLLLAERPVQVLGLPVNGPQRLSSKVCKSGGDGALRTTRTVSIPGHKQ